MRMPLMHYVPQYTKKCVFSAVLKLSKLSVGSRRWAGSELQAVGPVTAKARRPNFCGSVMEWWSDGDWQNEDAGDLQLPMLAYK